MSQSERTLTPETISIIKTTIPVLELHGLAITTEMYRRLLADPAIAALFNPTHQAKGTQAHALAMALIAYAKNIDNLQVLQGAVERITQKHVSLEILPEHYPHVATALLGAIKHVLGDAATDPIMEAWGAAYWSLADILINRERDLYNASTAAVGGWTGWRRFKIVAVHQECVNTATVRFKPSDGQSVISPTPGQFLGIDLGVPGHGRARRNYSITSKANNEYYEISVRHQSGGIVSSWFNNPMCLNNDVLLSAPAGNFVLPETLDAPLAFVVAGIGITPVVTMLESLASHSYCPYINVVHITNSKEETAFVDRIDQIAAASKNRIFVERIYTSVEGRPTAKQIADSIQSTSTIYLCGPVGFMHDMIKGMNVEGIPLERFKYETFGPDAGVLD